MNGARRSSRLEAGPIRSSHKIAKELNIYHQIFLDHLKQADHKKKLDVGMRYELAVKNILDRISMCEIPQKRNEIERFLKRLITDDE